MPVGMAHLGCHLDEYGLEGAFNLLMDSSDGSATSEEVGELLRKALERGTKPDSGKITHDEGQFFRSRLLHSILSLPDQDVDGNICLYLKLHQQVYPITTGRGQRTTIGTWLFGSHVDPKSRLQLRLDLVRIVARRTAWVTGSQARDLVLHSIKGIEIEHRLHVAYLCREALVPSSRWLDLLIHPSITKTEYVKMLEKEDEASRRTWRLALTGNNRRYLRYLLERTAMMKPDNLQPIVHVLVDLYNQDRVTRLGIERYRPDLRQVLCRRQNWLVDRKDTLAAIPSDTWDVPTAHLPTDLTNDALLSFLRGSENRTTIHTGGDIGTARELAAQVTQAKQVWKVTATPMGTGNNARVDFTKTGDWQGVRSAEGRMMATELGKVVKLLDTATATADRADTAPTSIPATDAMPAETGMLRKRDLNGTADQRGESCVRSRAKRFRNV